MPPHLHLRRRDHLGQGIDAARPRAAPPQIECEIAVAAADIEHLPARDRAGQIEELIDACRRLDALDRAAERLVALTIPA
jgi:hypothetical protein